jgi:hypothetical protein
VLINNAVIEDVKAWFYGKATLAVPPVGSLYLRYATGSPMA